MISQLVRYGSPEKSWRACRPSRLFLCYGFEQLGLRRISLDVLNFNPRAKRVYDKLGFVTEGVLREEHRWGDEWIDVTIMSMLAREWDRHRGRL